MSETFVKLPVRAHCRQGLPRRGAARACLATPPSRRGGPGAASLAAPGGLFAAVLIVSMFSGGCATITPATGEGGESLELDPVSAERARVTTGVKAALLGATEVDAAAIGVRLDAEAVRLEGFVDSEEERERALALARRSAPGREIVDALEIR